MPHDIYPLATIPTIHLVFGITFLSPTLNQYHLSFFLPLPLPSSFPSYFLTLLYRFLLLTNLAEPALIAPVSDWHTKCSLAEQVTPNLGEDMPPQPLAAFLNNRIPTMDNRTHTVTGLAFSQGWNFAGVTADSGSPESGSSATAEALSQQDADPAVLANPQETVPEVPIPDIAGSEASRVKTPAQVSTGS